MNKKRVIIVGAGVAGRDIAREIKNAPELNLIPVGFVDDDPNKTNKKILSIGVFGKTDDLGKLIEEKNIDEVIIAIPSANEELINKVIQTCIENKISYKIVPRVREIIEGKAYIDRIREANIEDLLQRPIIKNDVKPVSDFLKDKKVLITGAAGSIGSELSRQIASYKPKQIILFDWWENGLFDLENEFREQFSNINYFKVIGNIQDEKRVSEIFRKYKPDVVFHAAAYKHVPMMEENIVESVKNNIFGTKILAEQAVVNDVKKFLFVSTDKAVRPKSIMGATKLIGEYIVRNLNKTTKTRFMVVRFGNVLGSQGSVIPIFKKQIANGGPVKITDPQMTRFFMTIPEAANLILQAVTIGKGGEVFTLDLGEKIKITDLAKNLIILSGLIPNRDIQIEFTGRRPGEKLHEKLFIDKTKIVEVKNKIYKNIDDDPIPTSLIELVDNLKKHLSINEEPIITNVFREIIGKFPQ